MTLFKRILTVNLVNTHNLMEYLAIHIMQVYYIKLMSNKTLNI